MKNKGKYISNIQKSNLKNEITKCEDKPYNFSSPKIVRHIIDTLFIKIKK